MLQGQVACRTCVVQMDVGQVEVAEVAGTDSPGLQLPPKTGKGGGGAGIHQSRLRPVEEEGPDGPGESQVLQVDEFDGHRPSRSGGSTRGGAGTQRSPMGTKVRSPCPM